MTRGELEYAVRKAQEAFDKWNDCTGTISKRSSWYFEALSVIEDAVKIGAKVATYGVDADLSDEMDKDN